MTKMTNSNRNTYNWDFLNSFRFLIFSLVKLAKTLDSDQYIKIKRAFGNDSELMRLKGEFPYAYVESFSKLDDTSLPFMESFYDNFCEEGIS